MGGPDERRITLSPFLQSNFPSPQGVKWVPANLILPAEITKPGIILPLHTFSWSDKEGRLETIRSDLPFRFLIPYYFL